MTTHKVQGIIKSDRRRVAQIKGLVGHGNFWEDLRSNYFTYPSDKLILEVPLEAQPKSGAVSARIGRGEAFAEFYNKSGISIDLKPLPYKKDDILALGENQKVKVERVLLVEEREVIHTHGKDLRGHVMSMKNIWHSIILVV